jgi:hypothetical protein
LICQADCKQTMSLINRFLNKLLTLALNYAQSFNEGRAKTAKHRNFCVLFKKSERFLETISNI